MLGRNNVGVQCRYHTSGLVKPGKVCLLWSNFTVLLVSFNKCGYRVSGQDATCLRFTWKRCM